MRPLCDGHASVHKRWKHVVAVLTHELGPTPDAMLGATHCTKPEHAGADGVLTQLCRKCDLLLCRICSLDDHVAVGHPVVSVSDLHVQVLLFIVPLCVCVPTQLPCAFLI